MATATPYKERFLATVVLDKATLEVKDQSLKHGHQTDRLEAFLHGAGLEQVTAIYDDRIVVWRWIEVEFTAVTELDPDG